MNVLFLINHAGRGGAEKYTRVLCEFLAEERKRAPTNQIFFIYNEHGRLADEMKELGAVSEKLPLRSRFDFKAIKYLADYCAVNKIDVIHAMFQRENYIALGVKRRCPNVKVVYTSHIIIKDNFFMRFLNKFATKNDDAVIALCERGRQALIYNNYPADKIKIIPNGVIYKDSVNNSTNSINLKKEAKKEFGIPENCFVFASAARFSPEKGMKFLLRSAQLFAERHKRPFRILLAGDGEEEDELKKIAAESRELRERVIFAGYRDDVENVYLAADCYINSSLSENMSFAVLEAMSFGLPVIATKVGGNPDIINETTNCGVLVRFGGEIPMAMAMEKMAADDKFYNLLRVNALRAVRDKFNVGTSCENTYKLYKSIQGEI